MQAIAHKTASSFIHQFHLFLTPLFSRKRTWLFSIIWFLLVAPAQAAVELRVAIEQGVQQLRVGSSTPATIRNVSGQTVGSIEAMESLAAVKSGWGVSVKNWRSSKLWIEPSQSGSVFIGDRWYRGRTLLVSEPSGITAINYVDLEQYLYSVVSSEMPASWPIEALKAQAVASRSYAMNKLSSNRHPLFDLKDTVASQVYKGMSSETESTHKAVNETAGQIISYQGNVINAVFHSSSGGHTENVEEVWTKYVPYLRGVPDYDSNTPHTTWTTTLTNQFIRQQIPGIGSIRNITPVRLTQTGRLMTVRVEGTHGQKVLDADKFRSALKLKSTWVNLTPVYGSIASTGQTVQAIPTKFQVVGRGFGHGIGMSQWGAFNLSQQGYKYNQILGYYYKGTEISSLPQ